MCPCPVLAIQPENDAAQQTHIQLQLSLDRYRAALSFISKSPERQKRFALEQCYALYKLGRTKEAAEALASLQADEMATDGTDATQRAVEILNAQIVIRLHSKRSARLTIPKAIPTTQLQRSTATVRRSVSNSGSCMSAKRLCARIITNYRARIHLNKRISLPISRHARAISSSSLRYHRDWAIWPAVQMARHCRSTL